MRSNRGGVLAALLTTLGLSVAPISTWATPFQFTYSGTIGASGIPGMNGGDSVVITVLTDNGDASTISQSWNTNDLLSATLTAGSYSANYGPLISNFDPAFRTDALGVLDQVDFLGGFGLSDSFGIGGATFLFDYAILDFYGNPAVLNDPLSGQERLSFWSGPTAAPVVVPEPTTLALLGLGLAGLGFSSSRRGGFE